MKTFHHLFFFPSPVGEFQCPVLNKVFTEFTHIVAVKTTGNVFCYEVCFPLVLTIVLLIVLLYVIIHFLLWVYRFSQVPCLAFAL